MFNVEWNCLDFYVLERTWLMRYIKINKDKKSNYFGYVIHYSMSEYNSFTYSMYMTRSFPPYNFCSIVLELSLFHPFLLLFYGGAKYEIFISKLTPGKINFVEIESAYGSFRWRLTLWHNFFSFILIRWAKDVWRRVKRSAVHLKG